MLFYFALPKVTESRTAQLELVYYLSGICKNIRREWLIEKTGTYTFALKVLKGMEWCGQSGYMTILVPLIEKIADDNNYSLRYE